MSPSAISAISANALSEDQAEQLNQRRCAPAALGDGVSLSCRRRGGGEPASTHLRDPMHYKERGELERFLKEMGAPQAEPQPKLSVSAPPWRRSGPRVAVLGEQAVAVLRAGAGFWQSFWDGRVPSSGAG